MATGDDPATPATETGWYGFGDLPAVTTRCCSLEVQQRFGPSSGQGTSSTDSDVDPATGVVPVTLAPGQTDLRIDGGLVPAAAPASIGDRVWLDSNGDGIQGLAELGVSGVVVRLMGPRADGLFELPMIKSSLPILPTLREAISLIRCRLARIKLPLICQVETPSPGVVRVRTQSWTRRESCLWSHRTRGVGGRGEPNRSRCGAGFPVASMRSVTMCGSTRTLMGSKNQRRPELRTSSCHCCLQDPTESLRPLTTFFSMSPELTPPPDVRRTTRWDLPGAVCPDLTEPAQVNLQPTWVRQGSVGAIDSDGSRTRRSLPVDLGFEWNRLSGRCEQRRGFRVLLSRTSGIAR